MHRSLIAVSEVNDVSFRYVQNVLVLDRHSEELLKVSGQVELDFMSWLDVSEEDANSEYRSRLCGKELKRWDPTAPGTVASMRSLE